MAAKSDYLENKILDHTLRVTAFAVPSGLWVALYTTATDDGTGGTEVTGGSYARQPVSFSAASGGATSNTAALNFANMPGVTVTHIGVMDAVSAGNRLYHGPFASPQVVPAGSTFSIAIGELDITEA